MKSKCLSYCWALCFQISTNRTQSLKSFNVTMKHLLLMPLARLTTQTMSSFLIKNARVVSGSWSSLMTNDSFDCAILPLQPNGILHCSNPWYMDDDVCANEGWFTALKQSTRQSFDSTTDSITPDNDFPFVSADLLHGTLALK
jgi:hypothetical protein